MHRQDAAPPMRRPPPQHRLQVVDPHRRWYADERSIMAVQPRKQVLSRAPNHSPHSTVTERHDERLQADRMCSQFLDQERPALHPIHLRLQTGTRLDASDGTYRRRRRPTTDVAQHGFVSPLEAMLHDKLLIEQTDARLTPRGGPEMLD